MSFDPAPKEADLWRDALAGPVLEVAPRLIGALLIHAGVTVRITEVEAYGGTEDPGSHAFRGPTPRTQVMFGEAGHAYVYFSYGMHHCLNVVCGMPGKASAVLLRAGEVIEGSKKARERRDKGRACPHPERDLARGPARLASALDVDLSHNGLDLCGPTSALRLVEGGRVDAAEIACGPRVGVSGPGGEREAYPWRYWIKDEPSVSVYRAAVVPRSVQ